jgi:hypothetical protein
MAKKLILVNTKTDILKYDNRKAIELAQTLGRPLTSSEYESLKIKKHVSGGLHRVVDSVHTRRSSVN